MKQFNPDFEYSFWFWRHKFSMVVELVALLIDYELSEGEIEGMELDLGNTNDEKLDKWTGGLHYGSKNVVYMKFALDAENRDMVHVFISTHKELKDGLELINLIQERYNFIGR